MIRYTVTAAKPSGKEWHGPGSLDALDRYHEANSLEGIQRAVAAGAKRLDNDYMLTLDGVIVCCHSFGAMSKEGFSAPGVPNKPIDKLTWDQVRRLRAPDGTRIQRIETMMPAYAAAGIGVALELKGDGREGFRLITDAHMDHIVDLANRHGVRMYGKASPERSRLLAGLAMLRERGVWTRATGTTDWQAPEEAVVRQDWCPFAVRRHIAPGSNDPAITPRAAILHVAVSDAASLWDFFAHRSGGIESHFYITYTGKIEQYRGIRRQADANYRANDFAVSIETAGFGPGRWTARQLDAIKRLLTWLAGQGIPLEKITGPYGSGVGYHVQFGAPGPWTPVAKSCPGRRRIQQYNDVLVPWMAGQTTEKDWFDMAEKEDLIDALAEFFRDDPDTPGRDITGARVARKDGTVVSLGWMADALTILLGRTSRDPQVIVQSIPDDLAEQVVNLLAERLAKK